MLKQKHITNAYAIAYETIYNKTQTTVEKETHARKNKMPMNTQ